MDESQLESQLAGLFSEFVAPEPEPDPEEPRRDGPLMSVPDDDGGLAAPAVPLPRLHSSRWREVRARARAAHSSPWGPGVRGQAAPMSTMAGDSSASLGSSSSLARLETLLLVLVSALGYLLVIGLAEAITLWVNPKLGFAVYSLVLLALFVYATFVNDVKVGGLCLALTVIPLIRLLGLSAPWAELPLAITASIMVALLFLTVALVVYYLGSFFEQAVLVRGTHSFWLQLFLLVLMIGLPLGWVVYQVLVFPSVADAPVSVDAIAIFLLIALLVLKVLSSASKGRWQAFGRFLNIAIVPLLVVLFMRVAIRLADILG